MNEQEILQLTEKFLVSFIGMVVFMFLVVVGDLLESRQY